MDLHLLTNATILAGTFALIPLCKRFGQYLELAFLKNATRELNEVVEISPKALLVPMHYRGAAQAVLNAMAATKRKHKWEVRTVQFAEQIEKSVRLKGYCKLSPYFNHTHQAKNDHFMVEIQIDIDTTPDGAKITWQYISHDTIQLATRLQMLDTELHTLLADTNMSLLKNVSKVSGAYRAVSR
ncbi:MAG: hypothetical protein J0H83_10950 [Candidatus Melainabacteria bacterium]|jgi:hypothetical protein|nr:hypothetical protein [Candidatus Melainabacteria bacterium]